MTAMTAMTAGQKALEEIGDRSEKRERKPEPDCETRNPKAEI
jgi:hypothetical protein